MLRIVVMVKVVPKPEEVTLDETSMTLNRDDADSQLNPADKNAVELALGIRDEYEESGAEAEVIAVSMGPPFFEEYLRDVVAMGVDDAVLLSDRLFAGADTYPTSRVLAGAVEKLGEVDLVVCGEESSDSSTGQVPPGIATWLDAAQVTYASAVTVEDDTIVATRTVTGGQEVVRVPMPAVVSVEYGVNEPRFPDFKRKRWAASEWTLTVWDHEDLKLSAGAVGLAGSLTEVVGLEAVESPDRRGVWIEGTSVEQANELADVIRTALR